MRFASFCFSLQSLYKYARELLKESLQAAIAFNEAPLHGRVLFLLAKLSFKEAQYGQAISLCSQAQVCFSCCIGLFIAPPFSKKIYDGDEMFWYNTTMLMVDATLADYELKLVERSRKV